MSPKATDNDSDINAQVKQSGKAQDSLETRSREGDSCGGEEDMMIQQHFEFSSQNIPIHLRLIELVTTLQYMGMNAHLVT